MNNEQQTWILRKPIIGKKYVNGKANFPEGVWSRFIETKSGMATMSEEVFHETFVELDVAQLREQIEDLIQERLQWCGVCNDLLDEEQIKHNIKQGDTLTETVVDSILTVLGITERKN